MRIDFKLRDRLSGRNIYPYFKAAERDHDAVDAVAGAGPLRSWAAWLRDAALSHGSPGTVS